MISKLVQAGVKESDIRVFHHLQIAVGICLSQRVFYVSNQTTLVSIPFSLLMGIKYETFKKEIDTGSLGKTLLYGAMFGDAGAVYGSGLLTERYVTFFATKVFTADDKLFRFEAIVDDIDAALNDYWRLSRIIYSIISDVGNSEKARTYMLQYYQTSTSSDDLAPKILVGLISIGMAALLIWYMLF